MGVPIPTPYQDSLIPCNKKAGGGSMFKVQGVGSGFRVPGAIYNPSTYTQASAN